MPLPRRIYVGSIAGSVIGVGFGYLGKVDPLIPLLVGGGIGVIIAFATLGIPRFPRDSSGLFPDR
jgi:hypothetical protein